MKVVGFITEYNPFHYGHKFHLRKAMELSKASHSIAVMSGSFVQRGEPSIVDKWTKAKIAVDNGVDLVIELPFVYSTQSAELFALGGVKILDALKVVDYIAFGSEVGDLEPLRTISQLLIKEPYEYKKILRENLDKGFSFPSSRSTAISYYLSSHASEYDFEDIIKQSNNILAIEYLKALYKENSSIKPLIITRQGSNYNDEKISKSFSSATALRKMIFEAGVDRIKGHVPDETFIHLKNFIGYHSRFNRLDNYYEVIKYLLLTMPISQLQGITDMENGLENRLIKKSYTAMSLEELVRDTSSKRYPKTRIQRILIHLLSNMSSDTIKDLYSQEAPYIRVLAANEKGLEILKMVKSKSEVPILTKFSHHEKIGSEIVSKFASIEKQSTDLYYFGLDSKTILTNMDYTTSPFIKKLQ